MSVCVRPLSLFLHHVSGLTVSGVRCGFSCLKTSVLISAKVIVRYHVGGLIVKRIGRGGISTRCAEISVADRTRRPPPVDFSPRYLADPRSVLTLRVCDKLLGGKKEWPRVNGKQSPYHISHRNKWECQFAGGPEFFFPLDSPSHRCRD